MQVFIDACLRKLNNGNLAFHCTYRKVKENARNATVNEDTKHSCTHVHLLLYKGMQELFYFLIVNVEA